MTVSLTALLVASAIACTVLIAAGLLSVLVFPLTAPRILRAGNPVTAAPAVRPSAYG